FGAKPSPSGWRATTSRLRDWRYPRASAASSPSRKRPAYHSAATATAENSGSLRSGPAPGRSGISTPTFRATSRTAVGSSMPISPENLRDPRAQRAGAFPMDDSKGGKVPQHRGVERSDQGPFGFVAGEPTKVDFRGKLKIGKWGAGSRTFPAGRVARPERGNPLARQGTAPCSPLPSFHRPALLLRRGLQLLHRFVLRLHSLFHQTARFFSRGLIHGRTG